MTKLNLGCGFNKLDGYINVDAMPICLPDVQLVLDRDKWPWANDSVDEIYMSHVMEHLGETTASYFHVITEMYRVCKPGAKILIKVPHPRHDNFLHDATHVRPITAEHWGLFSKKRNLEDIANNGQETKLGLALDVDFEIKRVEFHLEPRWQVLMQNGLISDEEMTRIMRVENNVCYEITIDLEVIKNG